MQNLIDQLSKGWRAERSLSQMTLGKFIEELERLPKEKKIINITYPHSYRGYYSDLAFELDEGENTVKEVLTMVKCCLGETYTGYKGGDFYMDEHTPLWISEYGSTGVKIVKVINNDIVSLGTEEDD